MGCWVHSCDQFRISRSKRVAASGSLGSGPSKESNGHPAALKGGSGDNPAVTSIAEPSIQSLLIEMRSGGQRLATGTGFVMQAPRGPVLVTNWHNVSGRHPQTGQPLSPTGALPDDVLILHNRSNRLGEWVERVEPLSNNGDVLWHEHPTLGSKADMVALPLTALEDVALHPYNLAEQTPIFVGPADVVSVIGFPFGLQAGRS